MKEIFGNLWDFANGVNWIGITTNGTVNGAGLNIMGSGCAKEFKDRYPLAPHVVGELIARHGNTVQLIHGWNVFTFPTKHDWRSDSDMELIKQSAKKLAGLAEFGGAESKFYLPRPGVGAGRLSWEEVKPVIEEILPDNVFVITWG